MSDKAKKIRKSDASKRHKPTLIEALEAEGDAGPVADHEELTPEILEFLVDEAERGYERVDGKVVPVGRPPLSSNGPSRQVRIRVEPELGESLDQIAEAEERSLSEVARDALREYVDKHAA